MSRLVTLTGFRELDRGTVNVYPGAAAPGSPPPPFSQVASALAKVRVILDLEPENSSTAEPAFLRPPRRFSPGLGSGAVHARLPSRWRKP